jgi:glycosyltransferase involved in cell wall biosynthesis
MPGWTDNDDQGCLRRSPPGSEEVRSIFILVPSLRPTGPIKGAIALANALAPIRTVTVVSLKNGPGVDAPVDARVRHVSLAGAGHPGQRLVAYRRLLREAGGRGRVGSISLCFSADLVNVFCHEHAVTCASVRGNLTQIYRLDYGRLAAALAVAHLTALRGVDHVVAMTSAMSTQVARYTGRVPTLIGNFVDEAALAGYRSRATRDGPVRFVFLASLTRRKRPELVVEAMRTLLARGVRAHLDVIGDGPLKMSVAEQVARHGLTDAVTVHGHLQDPYPLLSAADAMVLPSIAEGIPRASLEALYLGVPCVLRDADGNREVIEDGVTGVLLRQECDLPGAMLAAAELGRTTDRDSLLPAGCRQEAAARRYLELVEGA